MTDNLKQTLHSLRAKRLIDYGNVAYQRISSDSNFKSVPTDLKEIWYSCDNMSFVTLSSIDDSDIDSMSPHELNHWINSERYLIGRLESIFSNLEKRK